MTSLSQDAGAKSAPLEAWLWSSRSSSGIALLQEPLGRWFLNVRVPRAVNILFFILCSVWYHQVLTHGWDQCHAGIKQQSTTHAGGSDVRGVCWWKWYCCLQCVFNSCLLSFLMKPRFYHQHEVEWIFISHASTELSARSNYTVLWEAARAQLDVLTSDLRCLQGRHLRK